MAEHELNKIVDDDGEVFNLRDSTKQPTADRVTSWSSTTSDTKYPSEKLVKDSLDGKQATLAFDGTYNASTNKAATVSTVTNAISGLDVSSVGGNGKYISAISETDGKISATATTMDTTPTASSQKAVTSGGVKSALDDKNWFKNKGPSYLQNSNAYYQCISAATNDFSGLVKLYDVTEFFDGTIVNQNERSVFFGDVSLIRDVGMAGCKYARVCAMIGYSNDDSSIILQSDDDNAYPLLVKEDFDRLTPPSEIGAYVISNGTATLDTSVTRSRYFTVDCSSYSRMFINAGFYNPSGYGLGSIKAYIFVNDSNVVLGNADGTNFDGYVDVPSGATKLYLHTNNGYSQVSVGPTTNSPRYFLAMRYVAGWPAGTIEYFGRFYTRTTDSASYSARPLLLTYVQNLAPVGNTYIPSGYVVVKSAKYTTHSAVSDKLATARKLKTNLARTADSTFDGSDDQTNIPVTGTLPVGNGGTGKASVTANSYLKGNGTGALVERTYAEVRTDLGLGSVYSKDVPSSGNASTTQVVMGNDTRLSDSRTPTSHASSATTYGVGTTSNYGHVKLATGDMNGASNTDGEACSKNHTHSQYLTSHQDISGKMNTSASNATAPSSSGGDGATATLLNNLTDGNSDIATTDNGDNVLIATTDNGGTVTNKWYKRKLVKLIPWIIKKLGSRLVYDCGAGSTSGDDFDAALAAFNAGQWVIIHKDGIAYYCVGSYSGPGLRFKQIANDANLLKVNTISWTRGSSPSVGTQIEASLSGHTHTRSDITNFAHTHGNIQNSGELQTSDVTIASGDKLVITDSSNDGKVARASASFDGSTTTKALTQKGTFETFMTPSAGNAASGALQNLTGQLTEGTSDFTDNTEMFTSYAGNSGFAESGHVNQPYRRKASSMLNYVRDGFAIDRSPANVGTTHKRISLGYGKYSSSNYVGAMTYLVRLFFNYADDGGLQGKGITVLVTYDFRRSGTQKSECRILSDNGVRDAGYNVVLANYVSGSGDNGKLYICIGLVKNSAPTTLVEFNYSYCKIFKVSTVGDWVQDISSDAVGTYNYIVQATDLVSAAVNADMVDGKHIVIGSWAGASNTIYFG